MKTGKGTEGEIKHSKAVSIFIFSFWELWNLVFLTLSIKQKKQQQ